MNLNPAHKNHLLAVCAVLTLVLSGCAPKPPAAPVVAAPPAPGTTPAAAPKMMGDPRAEVPPPGQPRPVPPK